MIVSPASRRGSFGNPQLGRRGVGQEMPELMFERFVVSGQLCNQFKKKYFFCVFCLSMPQYELYIMY